jgi:CRP-like cAMP-binding protein
MEGTILFEELGEINEIIFVETGQIEVGFDINKIRKYVYRYDSKYVIGAYNCTFNERSLFVYRCRTNCKGYYIRKNVWKQLIDSYPSIRDIIQKQIQEEYEMHLKKEMHETKEKYLFKIKQRSDFP